MSRRNFTRLPVSQFLDEDFGRDQLPQRRKGVVGGGGGDIGEGASGEGEGAIYLGAGDFLGGCFIMRILPI